MLYSAAAESKMRTVRWHSVHCHVGTFYLVVIVTNIIRDVGAMSVCMIDLVLLRGREPGGSNGRSVRTAVREKHFRKG
jgi:hypothetical protein